MTTIETISLIANVLTAFGVIGALVTLVWQFRSFKRDQGIALRDATLPFFKAWWGSEPWLENEHVTIPQLRAAFYELVGSPNTNPQTTALAHLAKEWSKPELEGGHFGLSQVDNHLKDFSRGRKASAETKIPHYLRKLTYFYDIIGWLGASGLIDVDYILGPMQHHMRRTWWVAKPLIERDRQNREDSWLDPVRHFGFQ